VPARWRYNGSARSGSGFRVPSSALDVGREEPGTRNQFFFNASTLQRFNASTLQRFNDSTLQRFNASTIQRFNDSTIQRFNDLTIQRFNDSTI
jgi:hypothetical protein